MRHSQFRKYIDKYIADELSEDIQTLFEEHMLACEACRKKFMLQQIIINGIAAYGKEKELTSGSELCSISEDIHKLSFFNTSKCINMEKELSLSIYIRCINDQLSMSAHEQFRNEPRTIEFFEDLRISHNQVDAKCHKLFNLLNNASKQLRVDRSIIDQAKYIGQSLFDGLFTLRVKELLYSTKCRELNLQIDGNLVQIPWELLYDGTDFLCQRFNIGRIVNTWQSIASHRGQERRKRPFNIDKNSFKMLILADPKGDLDASYEEGDILFEKFKDLSEYKDLQKKNIEIKLKSSFIKTEYIKKALREFDIIHYAGHAKYNAEDPSRGGWQTADGEVSTEDVIEMIGGGALPYLIFSNACQSGQTEPWSISSDVKKGIYCMANAFLLAGVYHYIGTFWDIPDKQGGRLTIEFYKNLMEGLSIGESLRKARVHFIERYGETNITWMAYTLYGDPTYVYLGRENFQNKKHFQTGQGVYIPDNFAEQSKGEGINYSCIESANISESLESVLAGETRGAESDTRGWMESENIFLKPISLKLTHSLKTALFSFLFVFIVVGISWLGKTFFFSSNAPDPKSAYLSLFDKDYFELNRQKINLDVVITHLIERLKEREVGRFKAGHKILAPEDDWTSKSMTMAVFGYLAIKDMDLKNALKLRRRNDSLAQEITTAIRNQNSLPLVDRKHLDDTFSEFKLFLSDLDRKKDLIRIGKVLGARFILFSELMPDKKKPKIAINVIETETTVIKVSFTSRMRKGEGYESVAGRIAQKVVAKIKERYPLKGKITVMNDAKEVMVNLGSDVGLKKKSIMNVLGGFDEPEQIGRIEITKVDQDLASAEVLQAKRPLRIGDRVIATPDNEV